VASPAEFDFLCPLLNRIAATTPGGLPGLVNSALGSNNGTLPFEIGNDRHDYDYYHGGRRVTLTSKERQQFLQYLSVLRGELIPTANARTLPLTPLSQYSNDGNSQAANAPQGRPLEEDSSWGKAGAHQPPRDEEPPYWAKGGYDPQW
jgi:hypothetical protein